uniref:Protein arginine N-methyltransferase domain-containing protein n=1 Tax=Ananas comosus var. bracteatus TaxID=296719 RepID=A0A6V7Q8X2_ANACO|nr:unnamed protein product [Ananas comosus var. bracteatus]
MASVFIEYALKSQFETSIYLQNLFLYGYGAIFNFLAIVGTAVFKGRFINKIMKRHGTGLLRVQLLRELADQGASCCSWLLDIFIVLVIKGLLALTSLKATQRLQCFLYATMQHKAFSPYFSSSMQIEFSTPGTCHGFALWIDWLIDERNSISISTGPVNRHWKQGVQLISKPVVVNVASCYAEIEASFDPSTSELFVKPSFSYPS